MEQRTDVIFFPVILTGEADKIHLYKNFYRILAYAAYWHTEHRGDMSNFVWPPWWLKLKRGDKVIVGRDNVPIYRDDRKTLWKNVPRSWPPMLVERTDDEWICVNPANPELWVLAMYVRPI